MAVGNSKTSNNRANGEYREILLNNISTEELATLLHMQEIIRSFQSKQDKAATIEQLVRAFFKPLQQTMNQTLKRLGYSGASLPTVYSTRHQAVANAKSSGLSDREIAGQFGHRSTSTAKRHYGKKLAGWAKMSFRPSIETLLEVKVGNNLSSLSTNETIRERLINQAKEWNEGTNHGNQLNIMSSHEIR